MAETPYMTILNNNSQIKKKQGKEHEIYSEKNHTFFFED